MPEEVIPIIAISGGILIAIVAIMAGTIKSAFIQGKEIALKTRMLEAGFSAQEIEQVLNCGDGKSCTTPRNQSNTSRQTAVPPQKPIAQYPT